MWTMANARTATYNKAQKAKLVWSPSVMELSSQKPLTYLLSCVNTSAEVRGQQHAVCAAQPWGIWIWAFINTQDSWLQSKAQIHKTDSSNPDNSLMAAVGKKPHRTISLLQAIKAVWLVIWCFSLSAVTYRHGFVKQIDCSVLIRLVRIQRYKNEKGQGRYFNDDNSQTAHHCRNIELTEKCNIIQAETGGKLLDMDWWKFWRHLARKICPILLVSSGLPQKQEAASSRFDCRKKAGVWHHLLLFLKKHLWDI